jgi:P pilus assembly chaperone PapD
VIPDFTKCLPGRAFRRAPQAVRLALAASGLWTAVPPFARAQLAVNRMELVLEPGTTASRVGLFTVRNNGAVPVQATVLLNDWDRDDTGENRFYPVGTGPRSCAKVLTISPAAVRLEPGAAQEIRVALDSAAPGMAGPSASACWSVAFVETSLPPSMNAARTVNYMVRTGVKVYVIPSGATLAGEITDMVVRARGAATAGQPLDSAQSVELTFHNTGTRHAVARGTLELRRADNSVAAKIPVSELYVLPSARRRVTVALPRLPAGRYVMLAILDVGGDELAAAQLEYEVR